MDYIDRRLALLTIDLEELQTQLNAAAPTNDRSIQSAWKKALGDTLTLAKSLHGMSDDSEVNRTQQEHFIESMMNSSRDLQYESQDANYNISSVQEKMIDLRDGELDELTQNLNDLTQENMADQQRTNHINSTTLQLSETLSQLKSQLEWLRSQKLSAGQAPLAPGFNIGFNIVNYSNFAGADRSKTSPEVLSIQAQIDSTEQSIQKLENSISMDQDRLRQLAPQTGQTELEILSSKLTTRRSDIQRNIDSINAMQQSLLKMKEIGSQLHERVRNLNFEATPNLSEPLYKRVFVTAILDLCVLACIDALTAAQVREIRDEIVNGYGSGQSPPSQYSSKLAEIQGKVQEMEKSNPMRA